MHHALRKIHFAGGAKIRKLQEEEIIRRVV